MKVCVALLPHVVNRIPDGADHSGNPVAADLFASFCLLLSFREFVLLVHPGFGPSASHEVAPSDFVLLVDQLAVALFGVGVGIYGRLVAQESKTATLHDLYELWVQIEFCCFFL